MSTNDKISQMLSERNEIALQENPITVGFGSLNPYCTNCLKLRIACICIQKYPLLTSPIPKSKMIPIAQETPNKETREAFNKLQARQDSKGNILNQLNTFIKTIGDNYRELNSADKIEIRDLLNSLIEESLITRK